MPGMTGTTPAPVTNAPNTPCEGSLGEEGWLLYSDHCYKVFSVTANDPKSWNDAHFYCRNHGSDLVSILDEKENSFILSMVY